MDSPYHTFEWMGPEDLGGPDAWRAYLPDGRRIHPRVHFLCQLGSEYGVIDAPRWDVWIDALLERDMVESRLVVPDKEHPALHFLFGSDFQAKRWKLTERGQQILTKYWQENIAQHIGNNYRKRSYG